MLSTRHPNNILKYRHKGGGKAHEPINSRCKAGFLTRAIARVGKFNSFKHLRYL